MSQRFINIAISLSLFLLCGQLAASESRIAIVELYLVEDVVSQLIGLNPAHAKIKQRLDDKRQENGRLYNELRALNDDDAALKETLQQRINALNTELAELQQHYTMLSDEMVRRLLDEVAANRFSIILSTDGRETVLYKRANVEIIDLSYDLRALAIKQFVAASAVPQTVPEDK